MAGLRTRPHFLRLLATLSSRNGLSQGVTGHTAAGTAPASHRIPFSRHLSHHDLLQSYEFFIQSFICCASLGLRRCAPFSLPPRAIIDQSSAALRAFVVVPYRVCARARLGLPGIKQQRLTFVRRCFGRDSVGIRTQDPQLRRLLLYPAELPNRSVFSFVSAGLTWKVGAKIMLFSGFARLCLMFFISLCCVRCIFLRFRFRSQGISL